MEKKAVVVCFSRYCPGFCLQVLGSRNAVHQFVECVLTGIGIGRLLQFKLKTLPPMTLWLTCHQKFWSFSTQN
jgi:hypothetical protein